MTKLNFPDSLQHLQLDQFSHSGVFDNLVGMNLPLRGTIMGEIPLRLKRCKILGRKGAFQPMRQNNGGTCQLALMKPLGKKANTVASKNIRMNSLPEENSKNLQSDMELSPTVYSKAKKY